MTNCSNASYDNRETCGEITPSSCVAHTGYISPTLFPDGLCRPNINDITKKLQEVIDAIKLALGDNTTLTASCFTFNPLTVTQKAINQDFITEICALKTAVEALEEPIDPGTIILAVDLLCLLDPACTPQATYTLTEVIIKLVTAVCNFSTTGSVTGRQGPLTNASIAAQVLPASVRTYIIGSQIPIPSTKLKVGSTFNWKFNITKTAAGVAASTYDVAVGITGTVGDAAILSFIKPAGTAAVDEGVIEITAVIRSIGVAGVAVGEFTLVHNLAATGHATTPIVALNTISAPFNTTTPNLFVGLCSTIGASEAITIQIVTAEALNL